MEPAAGPSDLPGWLRFRLWALLVAAAALAYVAMTPFFAPFMEGLLRRKSASIPLPVVLFAQGIQVTLFSALFAWIGLVCAPRVGLDAPVFRELAEGRRRDAARRLSSILTPAVLVGLGTGTAVSLLRLVFRSRLPEALTSSSTVSFAAGAATAFQGGVVEELILRWGALSAVLRLVRRAGMKDGFQVANVATAILFGAAHLPVVSLAGVSVTAAAIVFVVGANGLAGLIFGWLFRRRGLESAMIAHAAADIWTTKGSPSARPSATAATPDPAKTALGARSTASRPPSRTSVSRASSRTSCASGSNRGGDNGATTPSFGVSTVGVARRAGVEVRSEVHAAHRDHGRGHGVTWDCKDGSGPATGGTVPPTGPGPVPGIGLIGNGTQCFTGTTIQAFSAGMTYDF